MSKLEEALKKAKGKKFVLIYQNDKKDPEVIYHEDMELNEGYFYLQAASHKLMQQYLNGDFDEEKSNGTK